MILLAGHLDQVGTLATKLNSRHSPASHCKLVRPFADRACHHLATPADQHIPDWIKGTTSPVAVRVTTHPLCWAVQQLWWFYCFNQCQSCGFNTCTHSLQQAQDYFASSLHYLKGDLGLSQQPSES